MKRKKGGSVATDLRFFLQRAAAKKQSQTGNVLPSNNESQMQLVVYQGQSGKPPESVTNEQGQPTEVEPETPVMEDDDSLSVNEVNETDSSDAENDAYNIDHDPGLRTPISSYAVNDQDSVRRAYIALGPCQPKMNILLCMLWLYIPQSEKFSSKLGMKKVRLVMLLKLLQLKLC
jgi:hypothetical protein